MAEKLRVGIIGQGRSGLLIHAHALRLVPDLYTIAAVADPLPDRCAHAEKNLGCPAYPDYRRLFAHDNIDLIINASPSHLHVPITLESLAAGFNTLCEKPLARRAADADRLIAAARDSGRLLAIYQQSRFAPYFLKVKEVIASGVLGRIVMIKIAFNNFARRYDWQTLQEFDGGNLLNTGPHPLDQALNLMNPGRVPAITCLMDRVNTLGDAEDHVKLIMSAEGKPVIDLEISSCCAYPLYTYQVYGAFGGLTGNTEQVSWKYYRPGEAPPLELVREPLPGPSYCRNELTWHEESWSASGADKDLFDSMALKFYRNLHEALTAGKPLAIPPEDVRLQIAVIEECHRQNPMPPR